MATNMSFISIHYTLFVAITLLFSLIFHAISRPREKVDYVDSLFLCVSAMTEGGLVSINLSTVNLTQQLLLFVLTVCGSPVITSAAVLMIRRNAFESKFGNITAVQGPANTRSSAVQSQPNDREEACRNRNYSACSNLAPSIDTPGEDNNGQAGGARIQTYASSARSRHFARQHSDISTSLLRTQTTAATCNTSDSVLEEQRHTLGKRYSKLDKYIATIRGYIGRNSTFGGLSWEERNALGGVEYRAISLLCWVVPAYLVIWQVLGVIAMGSWCHYYLYDVSAQNGLNAFWTGAFFAVSAFNNSGMSILDVNATAFQETYFPLLVMSLLILAGNTCFPPFLRLCLWTAKCCIPQSTQSKTWKDRRQTLEFILDHPRRVYTHLFPSHATWWLVATLFLLNGIDWTAFELMNIGNPAVESIPLRYRVLDGLFQAFSVRIGGFIVVPMSSLRPALLVLYVVMMYISVYPITMAMRNTNVYEEQSLGIFPQDPRNPHHPDTTAETNEVAKSKYADIVTTMQSLLSTFTVSTMPPNYGVPTNGSRSFLHYQIIIQLSHDLWWIVVAVIVIQLVETSQSLIDPVTFSTFNMIFEVVSGYGTVGVSTGVPWNTYSFCGAWHSASKLVLCAVMLRGRHRGLPVEVDRAILLPGDGHEIEQSIESDSRCCTCRNSSNYNYSTNQGGQE